MNRQLKINLQYFAKTKISDVIVPEIFTEYVRAKSLEKNALIASGIMVQNEDINSFLAGGGTTMNIPRWDMISGEDELLSDTTPLTPGSNKASKQVAVKLLRGKAWSTNELAGVLAGSDPMGAIASQVVDFWATKNQATLLKTLNGAFTGPLKTTHVLDRSTEVISPINTLDTKQLLGDAAGKIVGVMMHSATKTALQKQNLIESIPNARGEIEFQAYLGYRIIEDDSMPINSGVYSTYFFTAGAIGYGNAVPEGMTGTETDRDSLQGDDYLINRQCLCMHPSGLSWIGTSADETPSNAELATGTNWKLSYENPKEIGLLCLKHKVV